MILNDNLPPSAAQRAFRERKQSQLAELQARLQEYQQGEIERNVQFQSIAKKLKEENDALKDENARLKSEVARLMATPRTALDDRHKRSHDEFMAHCSSSDVLSMETMRKRLKSRHPSSDIVTTLHAAYLPTPPADVSTPESSSSVSAFSPAAYPSPAASYPTPSSTSGTGAHGYSQPEIPPDQNDGLVLNSFDCMRGSESARCDCGEEVSDLSAHICTTSVRFDTRSDTLPDNPSAVADPLPSTSVLDNLPPYQPAVPLPRRVTTAPANRVFSFTTVQAPLCTGDPSSCPACADDPFGKAFCTALGDAVCNNPDCKSCPSRAATNRGASPPPAPVPSASSRPELQQPQPSKMIPSTSCRTTLFLSLRSTHCAADNCAWSQLKAHPNAAFADLRLLAEVVAGKQRCTGSRILFSPPPAEAYRGRTGADGPAPFPSASRQPSRDAARDCVRTPVVEVESANVRDALAYLDSGGFHHVG